MITDKINEIITPSLSEMGVDVVSISLSPSEYRNELEILIEKKDGQPVSVDLCSDVSKMISVLLDVEDLIDKRYDLVVSSAGINRPLVKIEDFKKFIGENVEVVSKTLIEGRKTFAGKLIAVNENDIIVNCDKTDFSIPFDSISKAKLDRIKDLFNKNNSKQKLKRSK